MLVFRHDVEHPDAVAARDSALRSLGRREAGGFRTAIFSTIREVGLRTRAGLYLGSASAYDVDIDRLDRVASRIVAGLFYHETGRTLPAGYAPRTFLLSQIDASATEAHARLLDLARGVIAGRAPSVVGRVLKYWWRAAAEDADLTAWFLVFYGRVEWLGLTVPRRQEPRSG